MTNRKIPVTTMAQREEIILVLKKSSIRKKIITIEKWAKYINRKSRKNANGNKHLILNEEMQIT